MKKLIRFIIYIRTPGKSFLSPFEIVGLLIVGAAMLAVPLYLTPF